MCLICLLIVQCDNNPKTAENNTPAVQLNTVNNIRIAYVNSDTVSKYYDFAALIQTKLLNKRSSAENQLKDKMNSYQKLRADFEKAAPIMGEREKMEKAQNIMSLEQEIMKVEQDLTDQLAQEELLLTESYILKTNEYMQIIGKELGYDFVLSFRIGGPMLYADSTHDITMEVIQLLNKKYNSSLAE
ncbi:MAG: OmpH family outer membrane protein [Bacteroidota bacterium]|nr:OmpH family outer membrane protein [Bacteroidota bacterium]